MAITLNVLNNKGGVGKTITTRILSELLAYLDYRVLVIDLDESSNLSMAFEAYVEDPSELISGLVNPEDENIHELFKYRYTDIEDLKKVIYETNIDGINIIPSSKRHKNSINWIVSNTGNNNTILKRALKAVQSHYDFVLIDNAPADNILTVNTFFASDYILVPVRLEEYSLKGLKETLANIAYIKEEHDLEKPEFLGTFMTQVEFHTNIYKEFKEKYNMELGDKIFNTSIRKDVSVGKMQTDFGSILQYKSNALLDYCYLLLEMNLLNPKAEQLLRSVIGEE